MSSASLTVAFLDVGQGDSTVLLLPAAKSRTGGAAVVVDCPAGSTAAYEYLMRSRVTEIPIAVVTHTDQDHVGGMGELLDNLVNAGNAVGQVAYHHDTSAVSTGKRRNAILRHLLQTARRAGGTISPQTGHVWHPAAGVTMEVLHPDDEDVKEAQLFGIQNQVSVLLRVSFGGRRLLLTGDLGGKGWGWILERATDLKADFLRYPHHGAWYVPVGGQPSLREVLSRIAPEIVIFSAGSGNPHGHPDARSVELIRSMPRIRFAHTQPTPQCYSDGKVSPWPNQFSDRGTVEIVVQAAGYRLFVLDDVGNRVEVR